MKVDPTQRVRQTTPARKSEKRRAAGGPSFREALKRAGGDAAPGEVAPVAGVDAVDALLAVQEVDGIDERERRGRARRHGEALLDRLEELRLALLAGRIPAARLEEMAGMVVQQREATDDPRLNEVLDEIELRVKVELAKLGL